MRLTIKTNFPEVQRKLNTLQADVRNRAMASAVNKTIDLGRTQMTRAITSEFNVTSAYVRERLRVRRAVARGSAVIEAALIGGKSDRRRAANIIAFVERVTTFAAAKKRSKAGTLQQLHVRVKKRGAAKPLQGAFIGNKGRTVFQRVGKERLPIKPVQTIDVGQMFNTRRINEQVVAYMQARFPDVAEREMRFFVDRFNRGGR